MTVSLITFGCKVNQYETQLYRESFAADGFEIKNSGEPSDIILINTCCVTKRAEKESRNFIARSLKISSRVIVTGCYVEKEDNYLRERFPQIEIVKRDKLLPHLSPPPLRGRTEEGGSYFQKRINKIHYFSGHTRAFIKIEDGCEKFCSYCIIPYVRGRVKNREAKEILEEIKELAGNGYQEFVITGVDLGAYQGLADLLFQLEKIEGVERIRLSSLEPGDITDSLIDILSSSPRFCPHLHIPLQSGDDKILQLMNRDYTVNDYRKTIAKIREKIPEICISTDVMVGFPGEDEEAFKNTARIIEEVGFSRVHCFRYSTREKTRAAKLANPVEEEKKKERVKNLILLAKGISQKIKKRFLGKTAAVLIEKKRKDEYSFGYSRHYLPVLIKEEVGVNRIIKVKIKNLKEDYLVGFIPD